MSNESLNTLDINEEEIAIYIASQECKQEISKQQNKVLID